MKEIKQIIKAYDEALISGNKAALATVVHLEGSSYRRPGARMLVTDDGQMTGAISGGCLEGDALRKALLAITNQQTRLVTYDTSDEDDMTIGIQLGCAGVIQVLFEPLDAQRNIVPIQLMRKVIESRRPSVLVTLFSLENKRDEEAGTCMLMEADGTITGDIANQELKKVLVEEMQQVLHSQKSIFKNFVSANFSITAFIEYIQPPVCLVVIGAGNDAIPMMQIADTIGWDVRVVDGRNTHANPERFASACQILVSKPESVLEQLPLDNQTVFVMMTHNYNYDLAMLKALLPLDIPYIGMLGPRKKLDRMIDELRESGMQITDDMMLKVFGPTGLEIGAETAEEIALSIIAEIKSVLMGKAGGSLRKKEDFIHSREDTMIFKRTL